MRRQGVGDKSRRTVPVIEELPDGSLEFCRDVQRWDAETRRWVETGETLRGMAAVRAGLPHQWVDHLRATGRAP